MNSAAIRSKVTPEERLPAMSVVCVGCDERGHRHIVHSHQGGIAAFLCGRWRSAAQVVRVEGGRRHAYVCHTCYQAWKRWNKEQST